MYGYVILTDIEKYSSLKDADLKIYYNRIIPIIFEELKNYKDSAIIWNTWGDAIFAIYDKAETAINMALAYRDAFNKLDFNQFGIKKLNPRIAGNFGEFELIFDPVSGKSNVHGTLVNLTARIEPVTSPGEIFVTKEFKDMAVSSYDKVDNVRFEDMGEITLPKNAGSRNLYRMCKREEAPVKPVGLIHSSINYQIQTPDNFNKKDNNSDKPAEKSIEQRLSENANKRTFSEEKLNKLASVLKDEKNLIKKTETNFIKSLSEDFTIKKNPREIIPKNPFLIAVIVFMAAMCINFILDNFFIKNLPNLNIPIKPELIAGIIPWMWLAGYLAGSFCVSMFVTLMQNKAIKISNIVIASFLTVVLHVALYILPNGAASSSMFFMQNFYTGSILLLLVCLMGLFKGMESAIDKIKASNSKSK